MPQLLCCGAGLRRQFSAFMCILHLSQTAAFLSSLQQSIRQQRRLSSPLWHPLWRRLLSSHLQLPSPSAATLPAGVSSFLPALSHSPCWLDPVDLILLTSCAPLLLCYRAVFSCGGSPLARGSPLSHLGNGCFAQACSGLFGSGCSHLPSGALFPPPTPLHLLPILHPPGVCTFLPGLRGPAKVQVRIQVRVQARVQARVQVFRPGSRSRCSYGSRQGSRQGCRSGFNI